jgi:hypothetical protein
MAKLKNPLFGFNARGTIAKALTFRRRDRQTIAETIPTHPDTKSPAQLNWRTMYEACAALWHTLSDSEKLEWQKQASRKHMTAFALWQSQCLRPNPGIYLPLAGGTMQGDIAMAGHSIINSGNFKIIRKTVDQTINNNDTPQDDDELFLPIAANEVWLIGLFLIEFSSADAGLCSVFAYPDGATLYGLAVGYNQAGNYPPQTVKNGDSIGYYGGETDEMPVFLFGTLINGNTAGTLQLQWAQLIAQESDTIVRANSCIIAWKLA